MGAVGYPNTWIPYINSKECTKQICSLSCPQWCYIIFAPPPPFPFLDNKSQNRITFSPLVIAIIGVLTSAFLLVSYYAIISKYCGNSRLSRREENQPPYEESEEEGNNNNNNNNNSNNDNNEFLQYEPWFVSTNGLDEAMIKSITLVKYNKGDGLIESIDCSVCLGEFLEDENLRLLPKCSHAFHVNCIDTWLKSHSNCPLCRANIMSVFVQPQHPTTILVVNNDNGINNQAQDHASVSENDVANEEISPSREASMNLLKTPFRTSSDLAGLAELRQSSHVTCDRQYGGKDNVMRRSISMDHFHETSVSISDMLRLSHGKDCQVENDQCLKMAVRDNSKLGFGNSSTSSNAINNAGLLSVMNSVSLKRSFSSGRFSVSRNCRDSNGTIPV